VRHSESVRNAGAPHNDNNVWFVWFAACSYLNKNCQKNPQSVLGVSLCSLLGKNARLCSTQIDTAGDEEGGAGEVREGQRKIQKISKEN
jgi:hypothetical protein